MVRLIDLLEAAKRRTPSFVKACVVAVMREGKVGDLSSAFAICQTQNKKGGGRRATKDDVAEYERILAANRKGPKKEGIEANTCSPVMEQIDLGPLARNVARLVVAAEKEGWAVKRDKEKVWFFKDGKSEKIFIDRGKFKRTGSKTLKRVWSDLGLKGGEEETE